eukprot:3639430-Prymnesium_polylepis.1
MTTVKVATRCRASPGSLRRGASSKTSTARGTGPLGGMLRARIARSRRDPYAARPCSAGRVFTAGCTRPDCRARAP